MIANAGFELAQSNPSMPDAWNCSNTASSTGSCSRDTVNFSQGAAALATTKTNNADRLKFYSNCIPVSAGNTYNVAVRAKSSANMTASQFYIGTWSFASRANCESWTNATERFTGRAVSTAWAVKTASPAMGSAEYWARAGGYITGISVTAYTDAYRLTPSTVSSSVDIAENYFASTALTSGTVVQVSRTNDSAIEKATESAVLIGIASTNPAITLGTGIADEIMLTPVALSGRVPAIVSSENGPIANGDAVTVGTIPGVGTKAVNGGMTVGKALEPFAPSLVSCPAVSSIDNIVWPADDGTNPNKPCFRLPTGTFIGKIMTFVNVTWFAPAVTAELHTDTLYADRVVARLGDFETTRTSTAAANFITNVTNVTQIFESTPSANVLNPPIEATTSALLALGIDHESLSSDFVRFDKQITINSDLYVLGTTTLGSTSIGGSLLVNGSLRVTGTGIESIADTLYFQKTKLTPINFMDGAMTINTNGNVALSGNLAVGGNMTVGGILGVNTIQSLGHQDIVINLNRYNQEASESATPSASFAQLVIKGVGNLPVAAIDASGSATFSGELTTAKLNIADVSEAGATVSGFLSGNAAIGTGILPASQIEVIINTTKVTSNSFIYITPVTTTNNQVLYVKEKIPGVSFTVGINNQANTDIRFNWWIIN